MRYNGLLFGQVQRHDRSAAQLREIRRAQAPDPDSRLVPAHGRQFIGHQPARRPQAILFVRFDRYAEDWSMGGVCCNSTIRRVAQGRPGEAFRRTPGRRQRSGSRPASFPLLVCYGVDELLILSFSLADCDRERLPVRFGAKSRRVDVGNPDLDSAQFFTARWLRLADCGFTRRSGLRCAHNSSFNSGIV